MSLHLLLSIMVLGRLPTAHQYLLIILEIFLDHLNLKWFSPFAMIYFLLGSLHFTSLQFHHSYCKYLWDAPNDPSVYHLHQLQLKTIVQPPNQWHYLVHLIQHAWINVMTKTQKNKSLITLMALDLNFEIPNFN